MKIEFGYGKSVQPVETKEARIIDVLHAKEIQHEHRGREAVAVSLRNPIGKQPLRELVKSGMKTVIVTSDISRPCPSWEILPEVLKELAEGGVEKENVTIVFALGSHRKHTEEEKIHLAGEDVYRECKCEDSADHGFVHLGTTGRGTPVDVAETVAGADFLICLGNIEYHYFAGYSGGYKAIMPGCSTYDAIQTNHTMMVLPEAKAGAIEDNPLRMDIEEAGRITGVDYIVNVVLDEHKKIVYAVSGDPVEAHRAGCRYLDRMYHCEIPEQADIVLVSQGGAPKDANLYQTQKALDNAKHAVREGGTIILIGACNEGFGSKIFEEWLTEAPSSHSLVERIEKEFRLGGHKAAAIGMVLEKARIFMVSEMPEDVVEGIFMIPFTSAQEAFDTALSEYGEHASVIAMPFGGSTLPVLKN